MTTMNQTEQSTTLAVAVADALPNAVAPAIIPGTEPKAVHADALKLLTEGNDALNRADKTAKERLFAAAKACESIGDWFATVETWKKDHKADINSTFEAYVATISAAWKNANDRAKVVRDSFQTIKTLTADKALTDKYAGLHGRASGRDFLNPLSDEYQNPTDYWRDNDAVKAIEKAAKKMQDAKKAADSKRAAAAALESKAAGQDGGTVTPTGDTRQTATLPEDVQAALNGIIRAVHAQFDGSTFIGKYPKDWLMSALRGCGEYVLTGAAQEFAEQGSKVEPPKAAPLSREVAKAADAKRKN